MARSHSLLKKIDEAILVDEVGIETGRYGPYLLKTLYQPVFHATLAGLIPWGVAATVEPQRDAQCISIPAFRANVAPEDRDFLGSLCRVLHLRNMDNIGVDGLTLLLDCDSRLFGDVEASGGPVVSLIQCLDGIDFAPSLLICEITEAGSENTKQSVAAALRQRGIRIAVGDFGMSQTSLSQIKLLDPEIVKLEGALFRRIAGIGTATRLLALLTDALRREGRQVVVTGIEKPEHLRVALDIGADFFQGRLLARAKPAGALLDVEPLQVDKLLASENKVIPLFGKHPQSR